MAATNSPDALNHASPKRLTTPVVIAAILVAATLFWFWRRWAVGVPKEWTIQPWPTAWPLLSWWQPLGVLAVLGGLAAWAAYDRFKRARSRREQSASTTLCVFALTLLCGVWPWALMGPIGPTMLIGSAWSDVSNEYFGTAYRVDNARRFTSEYSTRWQTPPSALQAHVATHPPGAVLFYYGARRIFESSPLVQSAFHSLAIELAGTIPPGQDQRTLTQAINDAREVRNAAPRLAGIKEPATPLPDSAVPAALWCQFLIALILATAVPAVYLLASATPSKSEAPGSIPEARGLIASALFVLAPCTGLFAFTLDGLIAAGAIWTLALCALRLRGGSLVWMVAAGAVLGLTSFVSFGAMATGVIVVLASLLTRGSAARFAPARFGHIARAFINDLALFGAGFIATWLVLVLLFPMQPLEVFRNAMAAHRFATLGTRTYSTWAMMNIILFAIFCGWPLIVLLLTRLGQLLNLWRRISGVDDQHAEHLQVHPATVIGCATLLAMLLLTLSGSVRGETERLWFFLLPPLCAFAATFSASSSEAPKSAQIIMGSMLLILQVSQTLFMAALLSPLVRPF